MGSRAKIGKKWNIDHFERHILVDRWDHEQKIGKKWSMDGSGQKTLVVGWVGRPNLKSSICIRPNTKYPPTIRDMMVRIA